MRQFLGERIRSLARVGSAASVAAAQELIGKIPEIDSSILHMQGMQALLEAGTLGDPRRMAAVMSHATGVPINIQPRSDGTYDILRGDTGQIVSEGLSLSDMIDRGRSMFDQQYVADRTAAEAAQAKEYRDHVYEMEKEGLKGQVQFGVRNLQDANALVQALAVAQLNGNVQLALQRLKVEHPELRITPTGDGSGTVLITNTDGSVVSFNPAGSSMTTPDGKTVTLTGTQPVIPAGGPGAGGTLPGTFPAGGI
jgi:hypothetical protein